MHGWMTNALCSVLPSAQNSCLFNNFRHGRWYGASEIWAVAKPDIYFPYCGKTIRICSADPSDSPNHCQATTMDVLIIDQVPGRIPVHMAYAVPEVLDPSFPGDIWLSKAAWDFIVGGGDVNTPHQVSVFLP